MTIAIVLAEHGRVPDGLPKTHVVEEPVGISRPEIGEGTPAGQGGTQEIVLGIPIPEVAAEQDGEHALQVAGRELGRGAHPVGIVPPASTTTVAPQMALAAHG